MRIDEKDRVDWWSWRKTPRRIEFYQTHVSVKVYLKKGWTLSDETCYDDGESHYFESWVATSLANKDARLDDEHILRVKRCGDPCCKDK